MAGWPTGSDGTGLVHSADLPRLRLDSRPASSVMPLRPLGGMQSERPDPASGAERYENRRSTRNYQCHGRDSPPPEFTADFTGRRYALSLTNASAYRQSQRLADKKSLNP